MPSNKSKGSNAERELVRLFTEQGWRAVRVAGSGVGDDSPCDILAAKLGRKGYTIEAKSSKKSTVYITKQQVEDFMLFSSILGLHPVIAVRFNHAGWFFLRPEQLRDTGKYWAVSLKMVRSEGKRFSQFFEANSAEQIVED
ncbi:nucleoid-structuring protein H-NS [Candidatus Pacearchaeota archaeon]|nr:nucleoid-structuring protein H-NS [Candidatus Pacearchaeota archaeon]